MSDGLLGATKQKARWAVRSGPLVFTLGCIMYVQAFLEGRFGMAVLGGLSWMSAVAQWSLEYMDVDR